jgi:hypothetical protein
MPWQKLGDKPAVDIVTPARSIADQQAQRLAAIEIRGGFSLRRRGRQHGRSKADRSGNHHRQGYARPIDLPKSH